MYAIIKTGGKQVRVQEGDVIDVELLGLELGAQVEFDQVLFINDGADTLVGGPSVPNYVVKGEVIGAAAGPKIVSLKYRPRQHTQKQWGHRQKYTRVKILDIGMLGAAAKPKAEPKVKAAVKPKAEAKPKAEEKKETKPKTAAKPKAKAAPKATAKEKEGK